MQRANSGCFERGEILHKLFRNAVKHILVLMRMGHMLQRCHCLAYKQDLLVQKVLGRIWRKIRCCFQRLQPFRFGAGEPVCYGDFVSGFPVCSVFSVPAVFTILAVMSRCPISTIHTVSAILSVHTVATILSVSTISPVRTAQGSKPLLLRADKSVLHSNFVGTPAINSLFCVHNTLQKLGIQIRCRRDSRFIALEAGFPDIQRHRHSSGSHSRIAVRVIAEHCHLNSTGVKLRRQITACTISPQHNAIHFIALRELYNFVEALPVAVKRKPELHKRNLVIREDLTLHNFNALVLDQEFPHYSRTSFQVFVSGSYCI